MVVPSGQFFTGAIHLRSHVDLHLPNTDSVILFSQDPNAYLPVVFTRWQGIELMNYSPPVYCYGQRNVAITGQGTLNGQADANHWWNWKNLETADFDLLETDGRRQRPGQPAGVRRRALPAAADDPAVPQRHRAASRASRSSTRRSGT